MQVRTTILVCLTATVALTLRSARGDADSLQITQPAGGEQWAVGSTHRVVWKAAGLPNEANVRVELSPDDGKTWRSLGEAPAAQGNTLCKVPGGLPNSVRLRVAGPEGKPVAETAAPLAVVPSQEVADYKWVNVTMNAAWAPRDGAGALVFKNRLWFLGGWNPSDKQHFPRICNNEVWSSADGATWNLEKPNTFLDASFDPASDWEGRHTAGYVVHKDRMWIVGGDVNQGHYHFDVWSSADGKTWSYVNKGKNVPWGPRALHYTAAFKDRIWVIGGQTVPTFAKADEAIYRDVWTTSDGLAWEQIAPKEPCWSPRGMIGGSVVLHDRLWILGGGTYDTVKYPQRSFYNDVWSTADGATWTRHVAEAPWSPRQYHDVAAYDGRMWVLEGYFSKEGGNRKDVWHSQDGVNWYEVPNTPWNPRHAASVYVHDGALWMVSGNNMQKDVWKLQRTGPLASPRPEP